MTRTAAFRQMHAAILGAGSLVVVPALLISPPLALALAVPFAWLDAGVVVGQMFTAADLPTEGGAR